MCPDVWLYIIYYIIILYYILYYVWIYIISYIIYCIMSGYISSGLDMAAKQKIQMSFLDRKTAVSDFFIFFMAILKNTINDGGVAPQHSLAHIKQPQKTHIEHMDPCRT